MGNALKKAFYIFLLGAGTYAWWRFASWVKQKIAESDGEGEPWSGSASTAGVSLGGSAKA